jgi:RNA polymerase sigma-B factor
VLSYLDLAKALATRFAKGREVSDLRQVAYLGLVKAARRFDSTGAGVSRRMLLPLSGAN